MEHKCHYHHLKSGPWDLSNLSAVSHFGDDGLGGETFPDSLTGKSKIDEQKTKTKAHTIPMNRQLNDTDV